MPRSKRRIRALDYDRVAREDEELPVGTPGPDNARPIAASKVFDPREWLKADRMTQTEASLRLAISLLKRGLTKSDVVVALTGGELTRASKPCFPVVAFLRSQRFESPQPGGDWPDAYVSTQAQFALVLHRRLGEGDVVTTLANGRRFAAEVTGGPMAPTRSPTEYKLLRAVIGRAVTSEYTEAGDLLVAVVPRSERFRGLAKRWREAHRLVKAEIPIVIVDRIGTVEGCPEIDSKG